MQILSVQEDLLQQPVEAIVNAWNRNFFPWWLLRPHGVSGAIKRAAGDAPFRAVAAYGPLELGQAVWTTAGNLSFQGIIHVACITPFGKSNEPIIRASVQNTFVVAKKQNVQSLAIPLLGSGSGGMAATEAQDIMLNELEQQQFDGLVVVVQYQEK